jgi:hypothetical protein
MRPGRPGPHQVPGRLAFAACLLVQGLSSQARADPGAGPPSLTPDDGPSFRAGTSDRRWLLQWDLLLALRGGYQIATPLTKLFGGHGLLDGECGYRFPARSAWSPYAIAGGSLEAQRLALTGAQPASLNDPDAVSGLNLKGAWAGVAPTSTVTARCGWWPSRRSTR